MISTKKTRIPWTVAIALSLLAVPAPAVAQTDEIQVYDGGLAPVGTFNLTWHNNFTAKGLSTPAFPGAVVADKSLNGVAEWALTETVTYLKGRYQFGRPVGGFQSLKHRLANLYTDLVLARAAARNAADALATGTDVPIAVAVAQARNAPIAVKATEEAIQLHGGIGMTWEHPAHLYLKRAKADELALGTPGRHRARLADLVDLPA